MTFLQTKGNHKFHYCTNLEAAALSGAVGGLALARISSHLSSFANKPWLECDEPWLRRLLTTAALFCFA